MTAYQRARPSAHWVNYPNTTYDVVSRDEFDQWDTELYAQATAVFNITSSVYNADKTGATDVRAALEAAIADAVASITSTGRGADVVVPAGVYALTSTCASPPTNTSTGAAYSNLIGIGLPTELPARLRIRGAGRGVTTFVLSDNARNLFWINRTADYQTFKNVTIEGLTVNNNSTVGRCHVLIGNMPAALTSQRRMNFEDIVVRDFEIGTEANPVQIDPTTATTYKSGVLFLGTHVTALEGTRTHTTNVRVEDWVVWGCDNAVGVTSWGAGSLVGGTNHYYNNVSVKRGRWKNASVPATTLSQTGVYVCGTGFGDFFEIDDVELINSGDNGIEVGAMQTGSIDNIRITDPFLDGILFRNTHALQDVAAQQIKIGSVSVNVTAAGAAVSGFLGRPVGWIGDNSLTFGEFSFGCLQWKADGLSYSKHGQADIGLPLTTAVAKITFENLRLRCTNYTADAGSGTVDAALLNINTTSGAVVIRDLDISATMTASAGASLVWNFAAVKHTGGPNVLTVDGYTVDLTGSQWTNSTGGACYDYLIAKNGGTNIKGSLRGYVPAHSGVLSGIGQRAISIQNAATIKSYLIANSDIQSMSSLSPGRDIEASAAGANGAKVTVQNVVGKDGTRLGPNGRRAVAADYTILAVDAATIAVTSTASARAITLPAANAVPPGQIITVADESNGAATHNITVQRAGSDAFTDAATSKVISTNGGTLRVYSTGTAWQVV